MKKKKYKLDELLDGINESNLHKEILTGPNVGKEVTKEEYDQACARLEEIIDLVSNDTSGDDPTLQELDRVSNIIEAYEEEHYPIGEPILEYKGFTGPIQYDSELKSYDGLVQGVDDAVIVYQGETLEELEASFRNGIDLYLEEKNHKHLEFPDS